MSSCVRNLFLFHQASLPYARILPSTIFNYSIVAPAFGELSSIYLRDLKGETSTSNILGEITSNSIVSFAQVINI